MTYINSIAISLPEYKSNQSELCDFMVRLYPENIRGKINKLYMSSGIESRYSVIPDYSNLDKRELYPSSEDLEPFPKLNKRMEIYNKEALNISLKAINSCIKDFDKSKITHLITVSCTGMYAPGLDLELTEALGLSTNVFRTSINFMGCYAAFHGLKIADFICKSDPNANVLLVCTELCTLHFLKDLDMNCITSNALFADGSASVLLSSKKIVNENKKLKIRGFYSDILHSGKNDMGWNITENAFKMILTEAIPELLKDNIKNLVFNSLNSFNLKTENINKWAIHPGGRKILDYFAQEISLDKNDLLESYTILKNYGNMSSPTVLYVLNEVINNIDSSDKNEKVFSAAFGPGLTMETMVLENV